MEKAFDTVAEALAAGELVGLFPEGRITDNWVSVDFASVLAQLGRDVFDGQGWEHFDDGTLTPPSAEKEAT